MPNLPTVIQNGNSIPVNQNCGTIVDVSGALFDTMQPMTFTTTVKSIVDFQVVETPTVYNFQGNWQAFTSRQLMMKPEGQRAWSWFTVYAQPGLFLIPDQVVHYLGVQYRVMASKEFNLNGYVNYELIQDWTGSGST